MEDRRRAAARRTDGYDTEPPAPPEYGTVTLVAAADDPPLRDPALDPVPLRRPTLVPSGGGVRELRVGDLIGRRAQLRNAVAVFRGRPAGEKFGAVAGVTLTGVGGIGKTAVAGRVLARLRADGWAVAVHVGAWNPPGLFGAVAAAVAADSRLGEVAEVLRSPGVEDTAKLGLVGGVLRQARLVVLFDDFEQNLTEGGAAFADPGFQTAFAGLSEATGVGKLLVTCRYPLPAGPVRFARVKVGALSDAELARLLHRLPGLRSVSVGERRFVVRAIGGHPRLLEFVDALVRGEAARLREVDQLLRRLAADHGIDVDDDRSLAEAVEDAMLLGSRDILLRELVATLSSDDRELLFQAARSRAPMSPSDLAVARWGTEVGTETRISVGRSVRRLANLTLVDQAESGDLLIHPWIADALRDIDRLAEADPTDGQAARDLSISYNKLAQIERAGGHLARAREYLERDLTIARMLADSDTVDLEKQQDVVVSLVDLSTVLVEMGNGDRGRALRREAAEIADRFGLESVAVGDPPDPVVDE
jgi:hypothetical protein